MPTSWISAAATALSPSQPAATSLRAMRAVSSVWACRRSIEKPAISNGGRNASIASADSASALSVLRPRYEIAS